MLEQVNNLKVIVKQELEIIKLCLEDGPNDQLLQNKVKLEREIKQIDNILTKIQSKSGFTENDKDRLDLYKLNISKLLLQNEKLYQQDDKYRQILNKVPLEEKEQSLHSAPTLGNSKAFKQSSLKIIQSKPQDLYNRQVKSNIEQLMQEINELNLKVETHKHSDYQKQIDKLREENSRIRSDCKLLKQDNTELLHTNHEILQFMNQIEQDNQVIMQQLNQLKENQRVSTIGQSISNFFIPYDESKAQQAEQVLNKIKNF
ncbi:hypothetical protein pb186bvf_015679 [Paramecium bursaria]